jgi:cobalamin biosynthesis Mg chelatase CobN
MDLFRRKDSLDVDTHAAPTPPYEQTYGALSSLLLVEYSTVLRGAYTTGTERISASTITSSNAPTTTTDDDSVASALARAGRSSAVTSTAIIYIILGVILVVIFMLLVWMFCIKRSKHKRREPTTPTHGLEMRTATERAKVDAS